MSSWSTPGSKFIFFVHYGRDPNDARLDSCRGRFGGSAAPSACQCFDTHVAGNASTEKNIGNLPNKIIQDVVTMMTSCGDQAQRRCIRG